MKAVILAAGEGKRMKPLSDRMPKMMLPILDKPFLEYILTEIREAGIKEMVIVISPRNGGPIREYFGDGSRLGLNIEYALQEQRKGTADAIARARDFLDTEYFLVHYGDSLTNINLPKTLLENFTEGADAFLTLREESDTSRYGVAKFNGEDITEIVEKPPKGEEPSSMVMVGVFLLRTKSFFDSLETEFKHGKEEFPAQYILRNGGKVRGWVFSGKRVDLGKPEDLLNASRLLSEKFSLGKSFAGKSVSAGKNSVIKNSFVNSNTSVGENTFVEGSYVMGNCRIGDNCRVRNSVVCCDMEDGETLENGLKA